ncbi:MAG: hypothetical protein A3J55_01615 [Candidatus Ryanbacteria bacterium RIFCSPHIGHO2_02_FULL_45_17b]|uniref:Uncharacterized protein n=1 Tax=Candidatus Ryanbacteria bacterium RIFCSPHIGHO2_01_FULL_45_22 TaxID=1802114 RepID=A0A1G2G2Y3_9BACT|nr:MAG: hypothetical protein A2719_02470 [Candidatus Ryanbacteria bacterium RIFCSPHIGHO2_01_FULL_45_22]OGZ47813.1 MAG: hypothetical protein A3J55_01615 [Candidatus Ryanbacteria bacterium RIFCSPHIGHO2_02_FULL_45_17b]
MTEKQTLWRVLIGGLIGNLFLIGTGFSFYFFFIQPTFVSLANASRELALLEKRETFLQASEREIKQRSNDLGTLNAAFLDLENAVPFVTLLEAIAARSGVTISIQANSTIDPAAKQAEFNITALGTLAQIMQFIKQAELIPYFTDITSLTISTKNSQIQATMLLTVLTL